MPNPASSAASGAVRLRAPPPGFTLALLPIDPSVWSEIGGHRLAARQDGLPAHVPDPLTEAILVVHQVAALQALAYSLQGIERTLANIALVLQDRR